MANTLGQTVQSLRDQLKRQAVDLSSSEDQIEKLINDNAILYSDLHDYVRTIKELRKQIQTLKHENAKLKAMVKGDYVYWNEAEAEAAALESGKLAARSFQSELQKLADKFNS